MSEDEQKVESRVYNAMLEKRLCCSGLSVNSWRCSFIIFMLVAHVVKLVLFRRIRTFRWKSVISLCRRQRLGQGLAASCTVPSANPISHSKKITHIAHAVRSLSSSSLPAPHNQSPHRPPSQTEAQSHQDLATRQKNPPVSQSCAVMKRDENPQNSHLRRQRRSPSGLVFVRTAFRTSSSPFHRYRRRLSS